MGSQLTTLKVRQSDLAYFANLEAPAFDIGERWGLFQSAIYAHLRGFGLRLSDIKFENATSSPGDVSIAGWMYEHGQLRATGSIESRYGPTVSEWLTTSR